MNDDANISKNRFVRLSDTLSSLFTNRWVAYSTILLLQWLQISGIWNFRDMTPGDTSSYFQDAYTWYTSKTLLISWSPLYTAFYGSLLHLYNDIYFATAFQRVLIVMVLAPLVLAVMRRLLDPSIAWLLAAWWVLLPINFDSLYEFHLFAVVPLLVTVLLLSKNSLPFRGAAVGVLIISTLLVRNEHILALGVLIFVIFVLHLKGHGHTQPLMRRVVAYGAPAMVALLVFAYFFTHARDTTAPAFKEVFGVKHTLNVCQAYAFGYQQRHPEWKHSPWTECQILMTDEFGKPQVSFFEALRRNPKAILGHMLWNARLAPNGIQIMLFNATSGTMNPDYIPIRAQSRPATIVSAIVGAVWLLGLFALWTQRQFWWKRVIAQRLWVWTGMFCTLPMAIVVLLTQRPRPSYLFSLALLLMACTGLLFWAIAVRWRFLHVVKRLTPPLAAALLLTGSSYYPRPGVDQPRRLKLAYDALLPYRTMLSRPGTVLLAPDYPGELCNYVGLGQGNCRAMNYWDIRRQVTNPSDWPGVLQRNGINMLYASEDVLNDPLHPSVITNSTDTGWAVVGQQEGADRSWRVLAKMKALSGADLQLRPSSFRGQKTTVELTSANSKGSADIRRTIIIINKDFVAAHACYISHDWGTGIIWLSSDDTKSWISVNAGLPGTAENNQCILNGQESSIGRTAEGEVIRLSLAFRSSFAGEKKVYGFVETRSGSDFAWSQLGAWSVTAKSWFNLL